MYRFGEVHSTLFFFANCRIFLFPASYSDANVFDVSRVSRRSRHQIQCKFSSGGLSAATVRLSGRLVVKFFDFHASVGGDVFFFMTNWSFDHVFKVQRLLIMDSSDDA